MTPCHVCRAPMPDAYLELAKVKIGQALACRDGLECAKRSNGMKSRSFLSVVGAIPVDMPEPDGGGPSAA